MTIGSIKFKSSEQFLVEQFEWAKEMALSYAHHGSDPVGLWYEAALPERDSFCIRDVSHQIHGATYLGLNPHSKNMLEKFIANISPTRDYCTYWEIDKEDNPTAVDYTNDQDFWYVLLANFELILACYQQYCYSGEEELLTSPAFTQFFDWTLKEYIETWDRDGDGLLEHYATYGRRGLASYNEVDTSVLHGGDMLAVQYAGYLAYSKIMTFKGRLSEAAMYQKKAEKIQTHYLNHWYNEETRTFYGAKTEAGDFYPDYYEEGNFLPIYFKIFQPDQKLEQAMNQLKANPVKNVEGLTYMAQSFYQYDRISDGWTFFQQLIDPNLDRKDYPEVSYSIIANYVSGLMGLKVHDYLNFEVRNNCPLEAWNCLEEIPLFDGTLDLSYESKKQTKITYFGQGKPVCKAIFEGIYTECVVNGEVKKMSAAFDQNHQITSNVELVLEQGVAYEIFVK